MVRRTEKTFRPNQGRAWIATGGIASVVVLKPLTTGLGVVAHFWMSDWEYSEETSALIFAGVYGSAGVAFMLAYLVGIFGFLFWFHRALANAEALGRGLRRVSPGAAVVYWFIPILNLFRPYHVVTALYRRSNPDVTLARDWVARWDWIPSVWWGTWVFGSLTENLAGRMAWSDDPEQHVTSMWVDLLSTPFVVAAGLLVLAVLWSIDARLDHLARTGVSELPMNAEEELHFIG